MKKLSTATVNHNPEIIYIPSPNGWSEAVGHRMTLDGENYAVIVAADKFNIFDDRSGVLLYQINTPINPFENKEKLIKFMGTTLAISILRMIESFEEKNEVPLKEQVAINAKKLEIKFGIRPQAKAFNESLFI